MLLQVLYYQDLPKLYHIHSTVVCVLSCVQLCVTLWTVAHQAPLSIRFYRQEYLEWGPFPPPKDLPDPGIKPASLHYIIIRLGAKSTTERKTDIIPDLVAPVI